MKQLLIVLVAIAMSIGLSGCFEKKQEVTLKEELRENFGEEKATQIEELIAHIIKWNDDLINVNFSDKDSINKATKQLSNIFKDENKITNNINVNNSQGKEQMRVMLTFQEITLEFSLMFMDDETFGNMNVAESKDYILNHQVSSIEETINKLLSYCSGDIKFEMNKNEWTEYLATLRSTYSSFDTPLNPMEGVELPAFE